MKRNWYGLLAARGFRLLRKSCGVALAVAAFSGTAWGFDPTPEIDPGSAVSSLALLAGGVMLLRDRYRRR